MRKLGREHNDAEFFLKLIETRPPEVIANIAIILINQADYLLYRHSKNCHKPSSTTAASPNA